MTPYLGVSRIEFQFCCLWTRFVSQGVVCLHSVGFGGSWTFTVIYLNVSRGSTHFVTLIYHLPALMSDCVFICNWIAWGRKILLGAGKFFDGW
jgi:hypothetical protein